MDASLQKLSVSPTVIVYDRLSDKSQSSSFSLHLPVIESYAKATFGNGYSLITEIGSAYTDDYVNLQLCSLLKNKNQVFVIYSTDRICRNLGLAGMIIEAIYRNNLTIHIVGIERPYVCSLTEGNIARLQDEMRAARDESQMKSERAIRTARHRQALKLQRPFVPPTASEDVMDVLSKMINGCPIADFYTAFNKITPYGETDNRLGGPNFILEDRNRKEFTEIKKGDFNLKDILAFFNKWGVYQKGKTKWTGETLASLLHYHFGLKDANEEMKDEMKDD